MTVGIVKIYVDELSEFVVISTIISIEGAGRLKYFIRPGPMIQTLKFHKICDRLMVE